mgnify:CR=1 FL=1
MAVLHHGTADFVKAYLKQVGGSTTAIIVAHALRAGPPAVPAQTYVDTQRATPLMEMPYLRSLQDEDEQLARALALSMEDGSAQLAALQEQQPQQSAQSAAAAAAAARYAAAPPVPAPAAKPAPAVQQRPQQQPQQARPAPAPRAASPVRSHPAAVHGFGTSNGSSLQQQQGAPISVAMRDGSAVVRRVIASDNSCLFNAVG